MSSSSTEKFLLPVAHPEPAEPSGLSRLKKKASMIAILTYFGVLQRHLDHDLSTQPPMVQIEEAAQMAARAAFLRIAGRFPLKKEIEEITAKAWQNFDQKTASLLRSDELAAVIQSDGQKTDDR